MEEMPEGGTLTRALLITTLSNVGGASFICVLIASMMAITLVLLVHVHMCVCVHVYVCVCVCVCMCDAVL